MKKILSLLALMMLVTMQAEAARGRQPCSGSKGGISHCTAEGGFICNDGSLSQSKRFCSGYGTRSIQQPIPESRIQQSPPKKTSAKKPIHSEKVDSQPAQNDDVSKLEPRKPTCAPLYMADKAGYTHLPICSGNQY